jgi:hypothetical protein
MIAPFFILLVFAIRESHAGMAQYAIVSMVLSVTFYVIADKIPTKMRVVR